MLLSSVQPTASVVSEDMMAFTYNIHPCYHRIYYWFYKCYHSWSSLPLPLCQKISCLHLQHSSFLQTFHLLVVYLSVVHLPFTCSLFFASTNCSLYHSVLPTLLIYQLDSPTLVSVFFSYCTTGLITPLVNWFPTAWHVRPIVMHLINFLIYPPCLTTFKNGIPFLIILFAIPLSIQPVTQLYSNITLDYYHFGGKSIPLAIIPYHYQHSYYILTILQWFQ